MAGLSIVIAFAFIYGDQVIRWSPTSQMLMFVITNLTASVGAVGFGFLQKRWGNLRTFNLTLVIWVAAIVGIWGTPGITAWLNGALGTAWPAEHVFLCDGRDGRPVPGRDAVGQPHGGGGVQPGVEVGGVLRLLGAVRQAGVDLRPAVARRAAGAPRACSSAILLCSLFFLAALRAHAVRARAARPRRRRRVHAPIGPVAIATCAGRMPHGTLVKGLPNAERLPMTSIGVDIGALFLKAVRVDDAGRIVASVYERHRGEPADVLAEAFDRLDVQPDEPVAFTGCNAELFATQLQVPYRDVTLCQIDAVRRMAPDAFAVMDIGGGSATLIQLDGKGKFEGYSTNSLCAAGTGSFLDEQAGRLGISYEDARGYLHNPNPPTIATRCTVFAKSDLIHRQQEGCSRMDMWSGLCRGMTRTVLGTLLNGRPLEGKTVLLGGVALNQEVVSWLQHDCPGLIDVPEQPTSWRRTARRSRPSRPRDGLALAARRESAAAERQRRGSRGR